MQDGLKIAFAGTPEFAAHILERILTDGRHTVVCVYTQPDKPTGRGRKLQAGPVKQLAEQYHLPVRQPANKLELQTIPGLEQADVMVVAAYGMIIPADVLYRPRYGCINIHTSLLPRWRGAAPVQRAILAGDQETGITIMQMDAGLDTGDILMQQACPVLSTDTTESLFEKLAIIGSDCILLTLDSLQNGTLKRYPQSDEGVTYASKIDKAEALIHWSEPAIEIVRKIRAFNPAPVAHTFINGQPIRIWEATVQTINTSLPPGSVVSFSAAGLDIATLDGVVRILKLQLPGKKILGCRDFYNGNPRFASASSLID